MSALTERLKRGIDPNEIFDAETVMEAAALRIEGLESALRQALRQWSMYADMAERNDGFSLKEEKSPEGDLYRAALALLENAATPA